MDEQPKPNGLIILNRAERLLDETYTTTRKYPKVDRYVLAADTREAAIEFLRLIIRAEKKYYKKTTLQDADIKLEEIRHLYRYAFQLHYIAPKRYEIMARLTTEIGRLLGGWLKQQRAK